MATGYYHLGLASAGKGQYKKALEYLKTALGIRMKKLGENHPDAVNSRKALEELSALTSKNK